MKKILILVLLLTSLSMIVYSQSGYQVGNYYAYKGTSDVTCGNVVNYVKFNGYSYYNEGWQTCRRREWLQEQYSGYVYTWNGWSWTYQWNTGYFWRFYWYDYQVRVY